MFIRLATALFSNIRHIVAFCQSIVVVVVVVTLTKQHLDQYLYCPPQCISEFKSNKIMLILSKSQSLIQCPILTFGNYIFLLGNFEFIFIPFGKYLRSRLYNLSRPPRRICGLAFYRNCFRRRRRRLEKVVPYGFNVVVVVVVDGRRRRQKCNNTFCTLCSATQCDQKKIAKCL